jgi:hypothetical protein
MQLTPLSTLSNIRQAYSFLGQNSLSSAENKQCKIQRSFSGGYVICHCVVEAIFCYMQQNESRYSVELHKILFVFLLLAAADARHICKRILRSHIFIDYMCIK